MKSIKTEISLIQEQQLIFWKQLSNIFIIWYFEYIDFSGP